MSDLIVLTRDEFISNAKRLWGDDPKDWVFECRFCDNKQSFNSFMKTMESQGYFKSQRYGIITKENISKLQPKFEQECISPDCNYVSYGLISGSMEVDGHRYLMLSGMND